MVDAAPARVGFFTDTTLCIGCKACEVACKEWNDVPADGFDFLGLSYDNTGELSADSWRHVAFVEQEEERTGAPDPVIVGVEVQTRRRNAALVQLPDAVPCPQPQLVERTELDRRGRTGLRTCGLEPTVQPVVAHRALPRATVVLPLADHPERARRDAVSASVAHVRLHDDGAMTRRRSASRRTAQ